MMQYRGTDTGGPQMKTRSRGENENSPCAGGKGLSTEQMSAHTELGDVILTGEKRLRGVGGCHLLSTPPVSELKK